MQNQANILLQGLNVIELQAVGPVPFAGRLLAELGATVTRVLSPSPVQLGQAIAPEFDVLNHGKAVCRIDLKDSAGKDAFFELLATADVLLEGFRPGVLEKLELAPQRLLTTRPNLVIGRLSGWGAHGPWAQRAGHDINFMALSGALAAMGTADRQPVPPLNLAADFGAGAMHLLVGVLAAVVRRSLNKGQGGVVETSITAGMHGLSRMFHGMLAEGRWKLERQANWLDGGAPYYRCYQTKDGGYVAVGAIESRFFAQLLELTDLSAHIPLSEQDDQSTWPKQIALFTRAFLSRTRDEWAMLAIQIDACVTPVLNFAEARAHAHNLANQWFEEGVLAPVNVIQFKPRAAKP